MQSYKTTLRTQGRTFNKLLNYTSGPYLICAALQSYILNLYFGLCYTFNVSYKNRKTTKFKNYA